MIYRKCFNLKILYNIIFLVFLFNSLNCYGQGDDPWNSSSGTVWNSNSNMTHIYSTYTFSVGGATSQASIGNPSAACDASATNDQWVRIPNNGCNNIRVVVNWENTNTVAGRTVRHAIYRGSSCTGSGSCNLSLLASQCISLGTTSDCGSNTLQTRANDVSFSAGEFIFVRLWDDNNSTSSRANVYAICGASSSPSLPVNEACSSPIYITNTGGCAGTNWSAPSGGFPALGSTNCSWGVNENPVFYEFQATATSMTLNVNGVRCHWPACNGLGSSLQFAVFPKISNCSSTSAGTRLNAVGNSAQDCYIGVGTVGGQFTGLTVGQRYLILLDGLNGARCSWTGISIDNAAPLPTVNNVNKCVGDTATASTLTISNQQTGYTYSWTSSPADPSLTGQTSNATINVKPHVTTTYTATINLGSTGNLCNGTPANAYQISGTVNILDPMGSRIAPTGAQCSGTQLNFTASPVGGNGTYTYSWTSNNPAGTSGTGQNFSFTPSNTSCSDIQLSVNVSVTSNGLTCPRPTAFAPTIKPNPTLTANPLVECLTGNVRVGQAAIGSCSCSSCVYTLEACTGCGTGSTPVGTTDTGRNFLLYDATGATFSASLNGCKSANQIRNFLVDCPTQLPVELIRFSVICSENSYVLNWTTASESDNSHFDIEKSTDAISWRKTGQIRGFGNSSHLIDYEFTDAENNTGRVYYRLKQVDHDGTFSYSEIISKECNQSTQPSLNIFPNPVTETIFIQYEFEESQGLLFFNLFDDIGRIIKSASLDLTNKSSSGILQIPVGDLAKGIYFMKINSEDNLSEIRKLLFK